MKKFPLAGKKILIRFRFRNKTIAVISEIRTEIKLVFSL